MGYILFLYNVFIIVGLFNAKGEQKRRWYLYAGCFAVLQWLFFVTTFLMFFQFWNSSENTEPQNQHEKNVSYTENGLENPENDLGNPENKIADDLIVDESTKALEEEKLDSLLNTLKENTTKEQNSSNTDTNIDLPTEGEMEVTAEMDKNNIPIEDYKENTANKDNDKITTDSHLDESSIDIKIVDPSIEGTE